MAFFASLFCETFTGQIGICKPKRIYLRSLYPWQLHPGPANNQTSPSTANTKYISKKLDISKAFDSVSWAFLLEILAHLDFGQVWGNLVLNLLATSSTRVLLNGDPLDVIRRNQCLNFQILKFKFCKRSWMENYQNKSCRSQKVMKLCSWQLFYLKSSCQEKLRLNFQKFKI